MVSETVELRGHIVDSLLLPKVLDRVLELGAEFEIEEVSVGARRTDPSYARIQIKAVSKEALEEVLGAIRPHGAQPAEAENVSLEPADCDGAFPEGFYSTTNLQTQVRYEGEWLEAADIEMDCGIVVDPATKTAQYKRMHRAKKGDLFVVGFRGVRVVPLERQQRGQLFEFMGSEVSPEKPKWALVQEVGRELASARSSKKKTLFVAGPAIVHTGAADSLAQLIRDGYISVLFAGNGVAAHDIEYAMFGTSLGVRLSDGSVVHGGHRNHLRAINTIRRLGGIRTAVEKGVLSRGIMHACITRGVPYVLAGSIRDDGPLPDVITDTVQALDAMREHARRADLCIVMASTLHAVATGNILPARTRMLAVDISPAALTKLMDRGSFQTVGIVSDSGLFLRQLASLLSEARG